MFTELSLGCLLSGIEIYPRIKLRLPQCFPLSVTRTYINVLLEVVCCCFPTNKLFYTPLNMTVFVRSQSFISLPSFMFVSAVVSELCELNQNKKEEKNSEIGYSQFNTFPGQTFPFEHMCRFNLLEVPYTTN